MLLNLLKLQVKHDVKKRVPIQITQTISMTFGLKMHILLIVGTFNTELSHKKGDSIFWKELYRCLKPCYVWVDKYT